MGSNVEELNKLLKNMRLKVDEPVAPYTSVGIGGPAEYLYEAENSNDLVEAIKAARTLGIGFTVLGGGTNVLISDRGLTGLVIINKKGGYSVGDAKGHKSESVKTVKPEFRWESDTTRGSHRGVEFKDLDYDESDKERIDVVVESGAILPSLLGELIQKGITGLQWFGGIPGTIGGAVVNNLHGGSRFFSEILTAADVLLDDGTVERYDTTKLDVDYDKSVFHDEDWIVLNAHLGLFLGDKERAKWTAQEWAARKSRSIPQKGTPGCAFVNITKEECEKFGYPTTSTGFIVEHVLKMSGYKVGKAAICKTHHNVIVNEGGATAKDYLQVIKDIQSEIYKELKIKLKTEIFLLGFTEKELEGLYR